MSTRLFFGYKSIDAPWGGANSFIRALTAEISEDAAFSINTDYAQPTDILFLNEVSAGRGGGAAWTLSQIDERRRQPDRPRIVVRAVNLRQHSAQRSLRSWLSDRAHDRFVIRLLNSADLVIFQSDYQKDFFIKAGVTNPRWVRIHNGAARTFTSPGPRRISPDEQLRLVSATFSPRKSKNHDIIARVASLPNVSIEHFGNWPEGLPHGNIKLMGVRTQQEMAQTYRTAHAFLHPAIKDPCPNAVFEAASAGLPVIYNDGPGSSAEILGNCGLALDPDQPGASINTLRQQYDQLVEAVACRSGYFSISRAAQEYKNAFLSVVSRAPE